MRKEYLRNGTCLDFYTPKEMKAYLDKYVVGQEEAKKALSVAVYNHYKRLIINDKEQRQYITKSNIMLCGPTGCGKTYMVEKIAERLGVPYYLADATTMTQAGYVGDDVECMLTGLLRNADNNIDAAEMGIVFLDECDKLAVRATNNHITRDVVGEGVQQSMLKMIEGAVVGVSTNEQRKHPQSPLTYIDTKNILFIASGAFSGIEDIVKKRFTESANDNIFDKSDIERNPYNYISPEDLKAFGLIPEFIGRFPVIISVSELSQESLFIMLGEAKGSVMRQYNYMFHEDGIKLVVDYDAAQLIAHVALSVGTGARALKAITECVMNDFVYEKAGCQNESIRITKSDVIKAISKRYGKHLNT